METLVKILKGIVIAPFLLGAIGVVVVMFMVLLG